jgi:hypothetical protein
VAAADDLVVFIKEGLAHGLSRADMRAALGQAGWRGEQIDAALGHFADVQFPIPVPRPRPYLSAREAFMYVLFFSTLYISAYQFGSLVFHIIARMVPDPASRETVEAARQNMRWSIAALIVAFPVFAYVASLIARGIRRDPVKRTSIVRKQLTYATLFIAAATLIGDVTVLVYNALGGELTTRFVLKVLTVGLIGGTVFIYYLLDLRRDELETRS